MRTSIEVSDLVNRSRSHSLEDCDLSSQYSSHAKSEQICDDTSILHGSPECISLSIEDSQSVCASEFEPTEMALSEADRDLERTGHADKVSVGSNSNASTFNIYRGNSIFYGPTHSYLTNHCIHLTTGLCYLLAVKFQYRFAARLCFGACPSIKSLLNAGADLFEPFDVLKNLYVTGIYPVYHLAKSCAGLSFLDACAAVSAHDTTTPTVGTFRSVLISSGVMSRNSVIVAANHIDSHAILGIDVNISDFLQAEIRTVDPDFTMPLESSRDVALIQNSAASLNTPLKHRQRLLEACGDAALTRVLARCCLAAAASPGEYQGARSECTSNANLSRLFVDVFPQQCFQVPAGVYVSRGSVGAKFFEAIIGYLDLYTNDRIVFSLLIKWRVVALGAGAVRALADVPFPNF